MCSGERGGLWRIKNHLREGQTKTVTRKFASEILFMCVFESVPAASMYVCVCAYKQH